MEKNENKESNQKQSSTFTKTDFTKTENNIKTKIKKRKKLVIILGIVIVVLLISGISSCVNSCNKENDKKIKWPTDGIGALLPKPESFDGKIKDSSNEKFECEIENTSKDAFNRYIDKCKDAGFNVDPKSDDKYYGAKDNSENKLNIYWNSWGESRTQMSIKLESKDYIIKQSTSAYENETLVWPTVGIATLLPQPTSANGHISTNEAKYFYCYVAKTDSNGFNDYIKKCQEKGFTVDFKTYTTSYNANDSQGNKLSLYHNAQKNEMTITLDGKNANSQSQQQNQATNSSSSVSPDLKSFLDSYEQFVDKYVAFMKKYKDSGFSPSMLKDYTDLMNQLADFNNKIATWDSKKGSMNAQDLAYYTEVITRCAQKLASVA